MLEPIEQISFDVSFIVESIPYSHFLLFEERVMYGLLQKKSEHQNCLIHQSKEW